MDNLKKSMNEFRQWHYVLQAASNTYYAHSLAPSRISFYNSLDDGNSCLIVFDIISGDGYRIPFSKIAPLCIPEALSGRDWTGHIHNGQYSLANNKTIRVPVQDYFINFNDVFNVATLQTTEDDNEQGYEGEAYQALTTKYERIRANRAEAILHHGTCCQVCKFDYLARYGEIGRDYIEVHHLTPLSSMDKARKVNPHTEMAVLCANCHRMVHRKRREVLPLDDLRSMISSKLAEQAMAV